METIKTLIILTFVSIFISNCTAGNPSANTASDSAQESEMSVIDYPLIDIPIRYNESAITLIIANNILLRGEEEYYVTNDKAILEELQSALNVATFPAGRGTTPDSCVYVYQDNILIKEVPFLDVYTNDDTFDLIQLSKEEVEQLIEQSLPSPI